VTYTPEPQNTLLLPSGTFESPDKKHLFVIMTKACADGQHLLLSVSSIKSEVKHDPTCELDAGCHPFVTKPSFVLYAKASRVRSDLLIKCVDGWVYTPKERLADDVFARVCTGVAASPFTPRWAKKYFTENS
jgi:hypothetical protein